MKMTLSKKLFGAGSVLLVALILVSGMSWYSQRLILKGYQELADREGAQMTAAKDAMNSLGMAVQAFKDLLIRGDEKYIGNFKEAVKHINEDLEQFKKLSEGEADTNSYENAKKAFDEYTPAVGKLAEARVKSNDVVSIDKNLAKGIDQRLRLALEDMDATSSKSYDEQKEKLAKTAARLNLISILCAVIAAFVGMLLFTWVIKNIIRSMNEVKLCAENAATGNLTKEAAVHTDDEIGDTAKSFNTMLTNVRRIVSDINNSTSTLASSSEDLSATSDDLSKGASELTSQTEQVVTAMTEVSQTIMDMAKNASQAADASKNASTTAAKGKEIVDTTASDMTRIAETVQDAATTIEELGKSSAKIGEIVAVINGIADQTNLLALNAAIEAARAGDQGRGFAVVADEVRKLAERTGQATKDITSRITGIQQAAGEAVEAMKKGSDEVDKGVGLAREASAALDSIVSASTNAMDMVQRIAAATEQQSAATEEVTQNMEGISGITRQSSASTEQIKGSASELARLASGLKEMTAFFKR